MPPKSTDWFKAIADETTVREQSWTLDEKRVHKDNTKKIQHRFTHPGAMTVESFTIAMKLSIIVRYIAPFDHEISDDEAILLARTGELNLNE